MNILPIKCLKVDIFDNKKSELKKIIPKAFESVKEYKSELSKKQSICGKYLIVKSLNCKEDDIYYNSLKKPYVKNNFYFNISHSNEYVVFVSSKAEIGIDIEYIDNRNMDVIDYAFTRKEIDYVKNGKGIFNSFEDRFTLIWTIKECLFKASGIEENVEPKDIETLVDGFNTSVINDNNVIENKINFYKVDYYVYSIKYFNYIISTASINKYSGLNLIHHI